MEQQIESSEPITFGDLEGAGPSTTTASSQVQDSDPIWGGKEKSNGKEKSKKSSEKIIEKTDETKELLTNTEDTGEEKTTNPPDKTAPVSKAKLYKIKLGENEIDFPDDATFPLKVGGQTVNVPLKDLASEYAGKTEWSRRFSDLDKEKKAFHTERSTLDNRVKRLYELAVTENKPDEAILYLADAVNAADPFSVLNSLEEKFREKFNAGTNLSEAEQANQRAEMQAKYYKNKLAEKNEAEAKRARSSEFETLVEEIGIDDVEAIWNEFKATGKTDAGIADIRERHKTFSSERGTEKAIRGAIEELNPNYGPKDKLVKEALSMLKATGLGIQDARLIVEELIGPKPEVLAKKIEKTKPVTQGIKKQLAEAVFFDDLDQE